MTCAVCGQPAFNARLNAALKVHAPGLSGRLCKLCYAWLDRLMRPALAARRVRLGVEAPGVPPCDSCGTLGGRPRNPGGPPMRINGERAGFHGLICSACYMRKYKRVERAKSRSWEAARKPPRPPKRKPCAKCGTPGGPCGRRGTVPLRSDGRRFGYDGGLCKRCYDLCLKAAKKTMNGPQARATT